MTDNEPRDLLWNHLWSVYQQQYVWIMLAALSLILSARKGEGERGSVAAKHMLLLYGYTAHILSKRLAELANVPAVQWLRRRAMAMQWK